MIGQMINEKSFEQINKLDLKYQPGIRSRNLRNSMIDIQTISRYCYMYCSRDYEYTKRRSIMVAMTSVWIILNRENRVNMMWLRISSISCLMRDQTAELNRQPLLCGLWVNVILVTSAPQQPFTASAAGLQLALRSERRSAELPRG